MSEFDINMEEFYEDLSNELNFKLLLEFDVSEYLYQNIEMTFEKPVLKEKKRIKIFNAKDYKKNKNSLF